MMTKFTKNMVIWVVEFSRVEYKIKYVDVFGKKSAYSKGEIIANPNLSICRYRAELSKIGLRFKE